MAKRVKLQRFDGFGPLEIKRMRSATRLVWQRCYARSLVIKRCTGKDGFPRCEQCKVKTPAIKVDHIKPVGDLAGSGYFDRLMVPSKCLQGLCKKCHDAKTKLERAELKAKKVKTFLT